MLAEAFRHGKAIGGWAGAEPSSTAAGIAGGAPGVVVGEDGPAVLEEVARLLGGHRVWDRFPTAL